MKKNITKIKCQLIKDKVSPFLFQEQNSSKSTVKASNDLSCTSSDSTCTASNFIPNFNGQTNLKNPIKYAISHKAHQIKKSY